MKAINITISTQEEQRLQNLVLFSPNEVLRNRCRIILLRAKGATTKDIASFVGLKKQSINRWLKVYLQDGIIGLVGNKKDKWEPFVQTDAPTSEMTDRDSKKDKSPRCLPQASSVECLSSLDAAIRLICENINSWDSQANVFAKMNSLDLLALVRNDCMQTAFLLGASPLMNESLFNIQRHKQVDNCGNIPLPGAEIDTTVECGVDLNGEALVRAKVTLK